ncbi:MAG: hypothetical protein RL154_267 [Pseudomonadota bacterium]|jgi:hypothetical protein
MLKSNIKYFSRNKAVSMQDNHNLIEDFEECCEHLFLFVLICDDNFLELYISSDRDDNKAREFLLKLANNPKRIEQKIHIIAIEKNVNVKTISKYKNWTNVTVDIPDEIIDEFNNTSFAQEELYNPIVKVLEVLD